MSDSDSESESRHPSQYYIHASGLTGTVPAAGPARGSCGRRGIRDHDSESGAAPRPPARIHGPP